MKKKILPILLCIMFLAWMIPVGTAQAASSWTDITDSGGFSSPAGVAVDSSGNLYVTDTVNNTIKELPNGTSSWTDITGSEVFNQPRGVAVDNSGNVYVADTFNSAIKELTNGSWTNITGSGGFSYPSGVAVDSSGNVYVVDANTTIIKELTHGSSSWTDITNSGGFNNPYGVAVDSSGNVYVTDGGHSAIKELTHGSSSWTNITHSGGFSNPRGVAVDSSGNVYVADFVNSRIMELIHGASSWTDITGSGGFYYPWGVAVDNSGNLYVTDMYNWRVMELPAPTPPTDITAVSLTGVVAPVTGAAPEVFGSLTSGNSPEYTVASVTWENADGSPGSPATLDGSGNFNAGSVYQVWVTLTSVAGYDFPTSVLTPTVDVGTAGAGTGYGTGNASFGFLVTFPATAADKTALESVITDANSLITSVTVGTTAGDVSQAALNTYQAAIDAAQAVDSDSTAVQNDVDAAAMALADATTAFNNAAIPTDITAVSLTGVIAPVTGATPEVSGSLVSDNPSEYTVASIEWLNSDGSPATLDGSGNFNAGLIYQVWVTLNSATGYDFPTSGLTPTVDVGMAGTGYGAGTSFGFLVTFPATAADKTALESVITDANSLITSVTVGTAAGDVSQANHNTYQAAIDAAQAVDSNTSATQNDVDAAASALADATAVFNGEVIPVDKSTLATAITNANALIGRITVGTTAGDVSQANHNTYLAAIGAAQAVDNDSSATQAAVNAAVVTLANATTVFNGEVIPAITISPVTPLIAWVGQAYNQTMTASGGTAPYTWGANGFDGLTFSSAGVWSGTPTTSGEWGFTMDAKDANGYECRLDYALFVDVHVTGVTLNKSTDTINAGGTDTLVATVQPSDATNKTVAWSSDDTNIATVDSTGLVTAVAKGARPANIFAITADGAFAANCAVTVQVPVVAVDKSTLESAITDASTLIGSVTIGTAVGDVSSADAATFQAAIDAATTVDNDSSATQDAVDAAVTTLATATTAFNDDVISALTLTGIAITTPATKLTYTVGDPLDITGLVVTGTYSDQSTQVESITAADVTGFDSTALNANETLTITYGSQTTTYTVAINAATVVTPTLGSIEITTPATKTTYAVGDTLDITGLVVTGTYSDNSTQVETITTADVTGFDSSTANSAETLTITYGGFTTTYNVAINAASVVTLTSIAITTPATKLAYNVGDTLDITGLVVTGTMSDQSTQIETITSSDVTGFDSSAPNTNETLTITYGGFTTTYNVTINAASVVTPTLGSIEITTPATVLTYTVGDPLSITGLVVTGTYSDQSTQIETITPSDVTGFDSTTASPSETLTITYGGFTTTYTVTINAAPAPPTGTITISPSTLPDGTVGTAYLQVLTASGGTAPSVDESVYGSVYDQIVPGSLVYTFSIDGTLPSGLALSDGSIQGIPTTPGSFPFTVNVTDNNNETGSQPYTMIVSPETIPVASITVTGAGNATTVENGSTLQMSAVVLPTDATDPNVTWSVVPGSPATMQIFVRAEEPGSATISSNGMLTATGVGAVTVTATNAASGVTGTEVITITAVPVINNGGGGGGGGTITPITPIIPVTPVIPVTPITPVAPVIPVFSDVAASYWGHDAIGSLSSKGYISGYPDGTFKPDQPITRAEFCAIMDRVLDLTTLTPQTPTFNDVNTGEWFDQAIETAVHAGIVKGYGDGTFHPNAPISRQEMTCVLVQALGKSQLANADNQTVTNFTDNASISSWARGFVATAVTDTLLKGYPDNSFQPQGDTTRAEACTMIVNLLSIQK
jgi:uncharacterized protein YjdB